GLSELPSKSVRLRRYAARPVAGGLGDPRRPPMCARGRQGADGLDQSAALKSFQCGDSDACIHVSRAQRTTTQRRNIRALSGYVEPNLSTSWPGLSRPTTSCLPIESRGWPAQG